MEGAANRGSGINLAGISEELARIVEGAARSVVRVNARRRVSASGVVWRSEGLILTADHVLERDEDITVGLPDGTEVAATVVGRDRSSDLALLRVAQADLVPLEGGAMPTVGHLVVAVGRPGRGGPLASLGIVTGVQSGTRRWRPGAPETILITDVVLYPGFSGGPLINANGQLVGINTSLLARGVSPAVPVAAAAQIAEALLKRGRIARGYLGVACQPVALPAALRQRLQIEREAALLVVGVEAPGPAETGGLLVGDILLDLGGHPVQDPAELFRILSPDSVGKSMAIHIVRGGALQTCTVTIGERG